MIEVTESGVIQGSDGALVAMRRLRELGVGLSIDDFGTGYSSLSRLAEFPIESLKIPKPFVDKLIGEGCGRGVRRRDPAARRLARPRGGGRGDRASRPGGAPAADGLPLRSGLSLRSAGAGRGGGAAPVPRVADEAAALARPGVSHRLTTRFERDSRRSPERGRPGRTKERDDRHDSRSGLTATTLRRSIEAAG